MDDPILWLGAIIIWYVVSKISHFIKKRRGNPDKYWEKYWAAKRAEEEEMMKDPTYRAQEIWDEQQEKNRESERQRAREIITGTGRYKHRKPLPVNEVISKIQAGEWPFSEWMFNEYMDGSLLEGSDKDDQKSGRKYFWRKN